MWSKELEIEVLIVPVEKLCPEEYVSGVVTLDAVEEEVFKVMDPVVDTEDEREPSGNHRVLLRRMG